MKKYSKTDTVESTENKVSTEKTLTKAEWLKSYRKKLRRAIYEGSEDYMERPPPGDYDD